MGMNMFVFLPKTAVSVSVVPGCLQKPVGVRGGTIKPARGSLRKVRGGAYKCLDIPRADASPRAPWRFLEIWGGPWESLKVPGSPWKSLQAPGGPYAPWRHLKVAGSRWESLEVAGGPRRTVEVPGGPYAPGGHWKSLEVTGSRWKSLQVPLWVPLWVLKSMQAPGTPWRSVGVRQCLRKVSGCRSWPRRSSATRQPIWSGPRGLARPARPP